MKKLRREFAFVVMLCLCTCIKASAIFCGPYTVSAPVYYDGAHGLVISSISISNSPSHCISLINCSDITIEQSYFNNGIGNGINLENCSNVTITNCRFDKVATGVYALNCQGITISGNEIRNVQGPLPRGQMVQFNNVMGPGNKITNNKCENSLNQSQPEDIINMYMSSGTSSSPIEISGNWIRGGGPSTSGGGILIGDNGGSYFLVKSNILVDPGQYGIGVASGTNITITYNQIYGKQQSFTNVGLYVYNQYPSLCQGITISHNAVNYLNSAGQSSGFWDKGNCGNINLKSNNFNSTITSNILPTAIITTCPTF
jgi:parallel beta-helix repeat protein